MKLLRYSDNDKIENGIFENNVIKKIKGDFFSEFQVTETEIDPSSIKLLPPTMPTKIVAVGLNYRDHAKELKMEIPNNPIIFIKPASTVIGPEDPIIYPDTSNQVDYEAELGIVIGKRAKNVEKDEAKEYILGYTVFNDVTARDLQKKDTQWTRSKSYDTFAPMGPMIETSINPFDLPISLKLNGITKQNSSTKNMIFDCYELLEFISEIMPLEPGDIIATGTPPGVGPMNRGDTVEAKIEGIGVLKNYVI
ncbi:MAG: fumarylacetoacetate hydrolase family protein [Candidatus Methanofastidiosa archaeon]|jgi:2-keto-4-pentenoate hydratase/2-oxohepta-3-ene-1,7-dioic acid hydratase in catechol pathway|nr:fumarylacetoacetate hydrolase family protein [Candidatus Methanofastidiosa archaeon]HOM96193.1 fumarylacetoacetate hydrolase family protein [Methanofastidiosum sp.]HPC80280.1 fumarylacetoacetate hydrolase family protein [Methanofastidiosum sp.]HRS25714.1 fumarylacetoacetate hydrolase family protein [Methanofastidiosum sp.]